MGDKPRILAVTMGDPAGIGLDIILKAARGDEVVPRFVVYGDARALDDRARHLGLPVFPYVVASPEEVAYPLSRGAIPVVSVPVRRPVVAGHPDTANAAAVIASIERAVADVESGHVSAVVTAPVAKATLTAAGFKHPGHTEFLAELAARHHPGKTWRPVMMLASDLLRVVPVTIHIPLADVPDALSQNLIEETIRITAADLRGRFGIQQPRIAVAGLNPHAGESGTLGREEIEIIAPAIDVLRRDGLTVAGPLSADTMFHADARARYDVAIAMYHDQALIPIKTLAFDTGVNATLGLPFVRTSPDHGTAFDIAGTGRANPASFVAALRMAEKMAAHDNARRP